MESKSAISTNRNNLLYEIFYNYSYLWHVIAHFGKIFFHASINYKVESKLQWPPKVFVRDSQNEGSLNINCKQFFKFSKLKPFFLQYNI